MLKDQKIGYFLRKLYFCYIKSFKTALDIEILRFQVCFMKIYWHFKILGDFFWGKLLTWATKISKELVTLRDEFVMLWEKQNA